MFYSDFTEKTYSITLATNPNVAPFSTYGEVNIASDLQDYGSVVSIVVETIATNPCASSFFKDSNRIVVQGAQAREIKVDVLYRK